jgi:isoleucyl-tRNA synthetase
VIGHPAPPFRPPTPRAAAPNPRRSPSSRTALAEAELEYPDGHRSRSVYVALPLAAPGPSGPPGGADVGGTALAVWTTTPWTLPANLAVAVNDRLDYCLVEAKARGGFYTSVCVRACVRVCVCVGVGA